MSKTNKSLLAIPLGGLGEFGMNMMVLRYGDDIIVIDAGMMFPESELLGVDLVIPDITYLKQNREHVRAIVLTHGARRPHRRASVHFAGLECAGLWHAIHTGAGEERLEEAGLMRSRRNVAECQAGETGRDRAV